MPANALNQYRTTHAPKLPELMRNVLYNIRPCMIRLPCMIQHRCMIQHPCMILQTYHLSSIHTQICSIPATESSVSGVVEQRMVGACPAALSTQHGCCRWKVWTWRGMPSGVLNAMRSVSTAVVLFARVLATEVEPDTCITFG